MFATAWLDRHHYGYLADLIVALHLAYVAYVVLGLAFILLGAALSLRARAGWFRLSHLVMIWIVAIEAVLHVTCPLTTWEQTLRGWADQRVNERTFVGRMMDRLLFVDYREPAEAPPAEEAPPPAVPAPPPPAAPTLTALAPPAPPPAVVPVPTLPDDEPILPVPPPPRAAAPPREIDLTMVYVGFAVFTSLLYMTYPPLEAKRGARRG